jgi:hypothetical protein
MEHLQIEIGSSMWIKGFVYSVAFVATAYTIVSKRSKKQNTSFAPH